MLERISVFFRHLSGFLMSLIRILLLSRPGKGVKSQIHTRDILILGNGPSLSRSVDQIGSGMDAYDLMAVNFMVDSPLFIQLKPTFYVLAAPEFWMEEVSLYYQESRKRLFQLLQDQTTWPVTLLVPHAAKAFVRRHNLFLHHPFLRLAFFNPTPVEGWPWFTRMGFRLGLGMPRPHNVLIPAILLAINLGYRRVILLGADHSWLPGITVDDDNQVLVHQQHFYDQGGTRPETMMKLGKRTRKLHEVLHKFMLSFEGYFVLKDYATFAGCQIWNATPGSFIDAFDRRKTEDLN